eukprot:TRINITY_DN2984_c0_g1_i2.p1 TRINITY_DN2984_c0_g1~~TRINITY_DN2984_c0_g1_i2.p1  ORF type:complete len:119 (-),score=28.43 TRINITY_DN2984_c0_g1_i2:529-885(-)
MDDDKFALKHGAKYLPKKKRVEFRERQRVRNKYLAEQQREKKASKKEEDTQLSFYEKVFEMGSLDPNDYIESENTGFEKETTRDEAFDEEIVNIRRKKRKRYQENVWERKVGNINSEN